MRKIRQKFQINASVETVYRALTDPILIEQWSESKAIMSDKIGGRFSLFNGYITGQNLEVVPNSKLIQEWKARSWQKLSWVSLEIKREHDKTFVDLKQEGIPDNDYVNIQQGWNKFYLGKMQRFFDKRL